MSQECRCGDDCRTCQKCGVPVCECYCDLYDNDNYEENFDY